MSLALVGCCLLAPGCGRAGGETSAPGRVIVLGLDGLDYELTGQLMAEGRLPNFSRLARTGGFSPLGSSIPPQSPVAWSNFITGMDPGGHGIFDFIHRDPETMVPYLSTSRAVGSQRSLKIGRWQLPIESGRVELLRRGEAFWEVLERRGVETTILRIPANFPPSGSATRELSGMGTPDVLGTYGTFSFYTSDASAFRGKEVSGGHVYPVEVVANVVEADLHGPDNPFLVRPEKLSTPFTLYLDPDKPVAKLLVGDEERVLGVGEWSGWVPLEFPLIPTQTLPVQAQFYLKAVRPTLELYVSPLNLDPFTPALPISTPNSYAAELARMAGRFYTQGMPEDTHALSEGVFTTEEFLAQAALAGREVLDQYQQVLGRFRTGLLFYYVGNADQVSHMMWRPMDPEHPAYDPERDARHGDVVKSLYQELDGMVGRTLGRMGEETTLVVMSDHGFTSWRRSFHLNVWLKEHGYLAVKKENLDKDPGFLANVDWARTRAYGLGLNALYINLRGRERLGTVSPPARTALMEEIAGKLLATVDPAAGGPVVAHVYRREQVYQDGDQLGVAPDLVVGYSKGTRCSNESAAGEIGREILTDNTDPWSGDHCMDSAAVPGILLTNRPLKRPAPDLKSLAAAILAEFGVQGFPSQAGPQPGVPGAP